MQFTHLRLVGFKSFVDATEMEIARGLTGIVGPNGCGKSNLVEALKWAMGETSAKQMRGKGMDDVIFGGTAQRPARNLAEVTLVMDNQERKAPASFNNQENLEITRQIHRGHGSTYKVNGQEVRAKDVQLMFADLATGAHSSAIVSQGKVGALISAKPEQRRVILEEAAGIQGLYTRRHEAELKLRAAENNLERLEDVLRLQEEQLKGLKTQARQAARYRSLSHRIRQAEAVSYHLQWTMLEEESAAGAAQLQTLQDQMAEATREVARWTEQQTKLAAELPSLREAEAAAAAGLQRLTLAKGELDREETRIQESMQAASQRLEQTNQDIEREGKAQQDANNSLAQITAERDELDAQQKKLTSELAEAESIYQELHHQVLTRESRMAEITQLIHKLEAEKVVLAQQAERLAQTQNKLTENLRVAKERFAELESELRAQQQDTIEAAALATAETKLKDAQAQREADEQREQNAKANLDQAEAALRQGQSHYDKLRSEQAALEALLTEEDQDEFPSVLDHLDVSAGYESALAAAMGEALSGSTNENAPRHWLQLADLAADYDLPAELDALSEFVEAPVLLRRALSQIGVASSREEAARLQADLKPGQMIVTTEGEVWRWDGYVQTADAVSPSAKRLEQRNRVQELASLLIQAQRELEQAQGTVSQAQAVWQGASHAINVARLAERENFAALQKAQQAFYEAQQSALNLKSQYEQTQKEIARLEGELATLAEEETQLRDKQENLEDVEPHHARADALKQELDQARRDEAAARARFDQSQAQQNMIAERLTRLTNDEENWRSRIELATNRAEELTQRRQNIETEIEGYKARPAEIETQRQALLSELQTAEEKRQAAADHLALIENQSGDAQKALRQAEQIMGDLREQRAGLQRDQEHYIEKREELTAAIAEKLECTAEEVINLVEDRKLLNDDAETAANRLTRLYRERETMGPVNLRAEEEAEALEQKYLTMVQERDELIEAIHKLRGVIGRLNREGRERLVAAFDTVNGYFQKLFTQLFGGGEAYLQLTESDDPLEAGLEIMASPPGKKLQNMTLLSGGEQALTAISLIFAVFLTNPAPICILDEVDAPLDDANVGRYCEMLEAIEKETGTRFLVITHNSITMARMTRLYGVTMAERGVSQLVSVDLQEAEKIRDIA